MTQTAKKEKILLIALRVLLAISFMLKCVFDAHGIYNSIENMILQTWALVGIVIIYGGIIFGLFWLISSFSYNSIAISKFFPVGLDGMCAVNRNTFLTKLYIVAIAGNLVMAALTSILYVQPVATAFIIFIATRLIALITVLAFDLWLAKGVARGKVKEYTVGIALPSLFIFIVLGV